MANNIIGVLDVLSGLEAGSILPINLTTPHPMYTKNLDVWEKCRDATAGQEEIKEGGTKYLPMLNGQTMEKYKNYKHRSHWYNASGRTAKIYLDMIFRKSPNIFYKNDLSEDDTPPDNFFDDVSADGKSLDEFIHDVADNLIKYNRCGVLVDFPDNKDLFNAASAYEYEEISKKRGLSPVLSLYNTFSIVNWSWTYIDRKVIPMYFVLKEEMYDGVQLGTMSPVKTDTYRILFLEPYEGWYRYKQIILKGIVNGSSTDKFAVEEVIYPKMDGEYIPFIPFYVMDDRGIQFKEIKKPMINDLVNVNIGHYMNSADWENELHMVGHKTVFFPGWDKKIYGNPVIGGALAGPANCEPKLLEASSDSGIRKEMDEKVKEMAVLGTELIIGSSYVASVDTAKVAGTSETAALTVLANKLGKTFSIISRFLLKWAGYEDTGVNIQVNTDYYQDDISGEELLSWMKAWQQGGISFETYFYNLKKKEVYPDKTNREDEKERIHESLNEQLTVADEKYMDILDKFSALEQDVQATITQSNSGQTLLSVSTSSGGSNVSTSTTLSDDSMDSGGARNNETPGSSSASAKKDGAGDDPEKIATKKKNSDAQK